MSQKIRVGILGATGTVGQRFASLLADHPQFVVTALAASDRSVGKPFADACTWRLPGEMPPGVRGLPVHAPRPPLDCDVIFSSLPTEVAREAEQCFAESGYPVISNSSSFRMDAGVPLLVPEVNPDHISVLNGSKGSGYVVTNPNCSAIGIALALAPLQREFGIEAVVVTTLQAISGAGYPGVPAMDITDNVVPFIASEEEKIERETQKILGGVRDGKFVPAPFPVSAQVHRVNVQDGHLAATRVKLARKVRIEDVREAIASFRGVPQELELHSAPERPLILREEPDRPQPRLDRDAGNGMSVTVGRLYPDRVLDFRFVALSHNTIRGAAGAAILNAELLIARGKLGKRNAEAGT
ncbi:MAG TPA: aspartate-semialdehyde dehydrogenase [Gemmatimonadales bacterium]|nr:aspartate-semialdehyde dehydrogenase [Gemmatimonadales bacterium]